MLEPILMIQYSQVKISSFLVAMEVDFGDKN